MALLSDLIRSVCDSLLLRDRALMWSLLNKSMCHVKRFRLTQEQLRGAELQMMCYERNCETAPSTPWYSSVILESGRSLRSHEEKEVWKSSPRRSRRERTRRVRRDCLAVIRTCHLHREPPHKFQHFRQTLQPKAHWPGFPQRT